MLGLLVGGALSLFGANKAKKDAQKATNDMNDYNNPVAIRARAEEAGFNPLLFVGPGVGNQTAPAATGQMGSAIADLGMMAAEKISGQAEAKARMQNLELQNQKLQKELTQATLRPKAAGLYGPVAQGIGAGVVESVLKNPGTAQDLGPEEFIGPMPMVPVWDANSNKWESIPPGVAAKLKLDAGQTILAEDYTAWRGEIAGEATVGTKILDGAVTTMGNNARQFIEDSWMKMGSHGLGPYRQKPQPGYQGKAQAKPGRLRLHFQGP